MTMQEYLITVNTLNLKVGYKNNLLHRVEIDAATLIEKKGQVEWIFKFVPLDLTELAKYSDDPVVKYRLIESDLSFDRFWNAFDNKVGKKKRAEALWKVMKESEKIKCFEVIPRYDYWLAAKATINKLYPETFLSQRRWENDFKI